MARVHGEVDIRASAEQVLEVLADLPAYPAWSSVHQRAVVDETGADGRPKRATMTVTAAGLTDEQVLDYEWTPGGMRWSLVDSSRQQRDQHGSYALVEHPDRTHVRYDLDIDPALPVPAFVVRRVMNKAVAAATEGLRTRVESLV